MSTIELKDGAGAILTGNTGSSIGILHFPKPMKLELALNPEAVLDYDELTNAANCLKAIIDIPVMSNEVFEYFLTELERMNIMGSFCDLSNKWGPATKVKSRAKLLKKEDMLMIHGAGAIPYLFTFNVMGDQHETLRQVLDFNRWMKAEGVLQALNPLWQGVSNPEITLMGNGATFPFRREMQNFGLFYYVPKGEQIITFVPKQFAGRLVDDLRENLIMNGYQAGEILACPMFLQHEKFIFNDDYLHKEHQAQTFTLQEGQAVFLQSSLFYQVRAIQPGCAISFNCIPKSWVQLPIAVDCDHYPDTNLTMKELINVKESATIFKNYIAKILVQQTLINPSLTLPIAVVLPKIYDQQIANQHAVLGDNNNDNEDEADSDDIAGAPVLQGQPQISSSSSDEDLQHED